MKFPIGDTARRRPDVVAVHLHHEREVALRSGQSRLDMLALGGQVRVLHAGESDIVDTGIEAHCRSQSESMTPGFTFFRDRTARTVGWSASRAEILSTL